MRIKVLSNLFMRAVKFLFLATLFNVTLILHMSSSTKKLLATFKSSLIIRVKSKPPTDKNLDYTSKIYLTENPYALNKNKIILNLQTHINSLVTSLIYIGNYSISINDTLLCISKLSINKTFGDYKNCSLLAMDKYFGIQSPTNLLVYEYKESLVLVKEVMGSISSYTDNILIISNKHNLVIYHNLNEIGTITLPSIPTCIISDLMLTKIYCGTKTGTILCINFDGSKNKSLEFHKAEIVSVKFSFCNQYLYTADKDGLICVWDVKGNVVCDKIEVGGEVYSMDVVLE